jgi:predicted phage terminase large subunit-like protein
MFDQKWFKKIQANEIPADLKKIRYWDFAATEANENNNPDWTCGVLMGEKNGDIYILDVERFREAPGTTIQNVISCAERDGADVSIRWEEEKGSAGRFNSSHLIGKLLGYDAHPDPVSGDKIERGKPFAAAAEHGHVFILYAKWNSLYTSEAGSFGSGRGKKDQIDASNGALKCLCLQKRVWNNFNISKTKKYQIEWNQSTTHTHNYGALVQLEDNSIYFLACLWDSIDTRLYIYHADKYTSVIPELIISDIYKTMNLKVQGNNKLFGNDLLLSEGKSISRLLNEELRKKSAKVSITFPVMFDLNGSIVYVLSMFNSDVVMVHKDLAEASAQFAGWSYKEGKHKPEEGYGYCECLCLIASELKKQLQKEHKDPVNKDYHTKEKPKEVKTTWQTV